MYSTRLLFCALDGCVERCANGEQERECSGEILLLTGEEPELDRDCLYLGDAGVTARVLGSLAPACSALLLCAGDSASLRAAPIPPNVFLLVADLSLQALYNRVYTALKRHREWLESLESALNGGGLQAMLDAVAGQLRATMVVLNAGYKQLAAVYRPEETDPFAAELRQNGYLSFESVQQLTAALTTDRQGQSRTLLLPIHQQGGTAGRIYFSFDRPDALQKQHWLCRVVAALTGDYLSGTQGEKFAENSEFAALASDLIELRLTNLDELEQRLRSTRLLVKKYYHVLVLRFSEQEEDGAPQQHLPWNYIISQLEQVFPFSNITVYRGEILALVRKSRNNGRLAFDREPLVRLLECYHGYAAIGNYSKFLTSLPPIYYQTRSIIDIGLSMRGDPGERIFYYEDYAVYLTVELCARAGRQRFGSSNLVYLCTPALIALLRYDGKHGTDFCKVLHAYLKNDRNVSATAAELYIHRNTMMYKLKRMEEIMGDSLDDSMVRERLLFSFRVIEYLQKCRHEDILILKPNLPEPSADRQ